MKFDCATDPQTSKRMHLLNEQGEIVPSACAFDTDEGWFEMYLPASKDRCYIDRKNQQIFKVRIHTGFDVRDRETDEVLHSVRWSLTSPTHVLESSF
jgi:hypothetical protein